MRWILTALLLAGVAAPSLPVRAEDHAPVRDTPFPDVPRDHWAFDAVEQLRKAGVVRGYPPQQTFQPPRRPARTPAKRKRA